MRPTGPQLPVLEDIAGNLVEGGAQYDVSSGGMVLAYLEGAWETEPYAVVAVDRTGRVGSLIPEPGVFGGPQLSPSGDRLALSVLRDDNWDVWVHDLEREVATRLTFSEGYDADPVWSPDGRWIAFGSSEQGGTMVYRKRSDGSGEVEAWRERRAWRARRSPSTGHQTAKAPRAVRRRRRPVGSDDRWR